jgi:hypothetical protein
LYTRSIRTVVFLVGLVLFFVGISISPQPRARAATIPPPPTPLPTSNPTAAQQALAFIAKREHIPLANLLVVHEFPRDALILGRGFQSVTLVHQQDGRFFTVLVDLQSGKFENPSDIEKAEARALRAKYGKLLPALYDRLQTMQETDTVPVMIWVANQPGQHRGAREQAALAALAAKYPHVRAALARSGKPMDVGDRALSRQIEKEYAALLDAGVDQTIQPLVKALETSKIQAAISPGLPAVSVALTKRAILLFAQRSDVGMIDLAEGRLRHLDLASAVSSNRAPVV